MGVPKPDPPLANLSGGLLVSRGGIRPRAPAPLALAHSSQPPPPLYGWVGYGGKETARSIVPKQAKDRPSETRGVDNPPFLLFSWSSSPGDLSIQRKLSVRSVLSTSSGPTPCYYRASSSVTFRRPLLFSFISYSSTATFVQSPLST